MLECTILFLPLLEYLLAFEKLSLYLFHIEGCAENLPKLI